MNAVNYIENYFIQNLDAETHTATDVYNIFKENYPQVNCTFPYFRTKFNNKIKSISTNSSVEEITTNVETIKLVAHSHSNKASRTVKSYTNPDVELPEPGELLPTGTKFDEFISDRITTEEQKQEYFSKFGEDMPEEKIEIGGFTRKCVDVTAGLPGTGKTTSRCKLAAKAKIFSRLERSKELKVGFLSGEMRESEWAKELKKSNLLREVEVEYICDWAGSDNYEALLYEAIADYDIVIIDSFPVLIGHILMNPKEKRNEKTITRDLIKGLIEISEKANNNIQLINQCNKDGNYKGGTDLPHMMTSQSFVHLDGQKRYMEYEKNRNNGNVRRKLYFSNNEHGDIIFDEETYDMSYNMKVDVSMSLAELVNSMNQKVETLDENILNEIESIEQNEQIEEIQN